MNEELQSKLVEILGGIQSATKAAGDFAIEQLPDIAQQYVLYGRVAGTVWLAVWLLVFAVSLVVALRVGFLNTAAVHKGGFLDGDWHGSRVTAAFCGSLASLISFTAACGFASNAALVWFAPKVWLLKEIATLIK